MAVHEIARRLVGGVWRTVDAEEDGGGGSQPQTATSTVTTDANTFYVTHVFDLTKPTVVNYVATVLALTPDGETFGGGSGDIEVDVISMVSMDGTNYYGTSNGIEPVLGSWAPVAPLQNPPVDAVAEFLSGAGMTPRYLKLLAFIYDVDGGDIYAGANNPQAQVRVDIEYL